MADLSTLLVAVKAVNDGDFITSESYNDMRAALLALAEQVGEGGNTLDVRFGAAFSQSDPTEVSWLQYKGYVTKPPAGEAEGWMPVNLPDGSKIQRVTVLGRRNGPMNYFTVTLARQPITATSEETLVEVPLETTNTTQQAFSASGGPVPGIGAEPINNTAYKYYLSASLGAATNATTAQIHAVVITLSRS